MKNSFIQITLAIILSFGTAFIANAQYHTVDSEAYQEIDEDLINKVLTTKLLLETAGYTIVGTGDDYLSEKEKFIGMRTCYSGNNYVVIAVSGEGVNDLDLYIYNDYGKLITKDMKTSDDGITIAEFYQSETKDMKIMVKNYDSASPFKKYPVMIIVAYQ